GTKEYGGVGRYCSAPPQFDVFRWQGTVERSVTEGISFAEPHRAVTSLAKLYRICEYRLKYRLQFSGRARDDAKHLRSRGLLLQCLGEVPPRLVEFALVCFELPFQVAARLAHLTNVRSRLRSGRTAFVTLRSAFCGFARRGHLNRPHAEDQAFRAKRISRKPERV